MAKSIADVIARYREGAIATGDRRSARRANKGAKQLHACYKILRESEEGRAALVSLMQDPEPSVRCWAAAQCLQWQTKIARRVLESLCDSDGPFSFDAKITLQEYENGRLKFD